MYEGTPTDLIEPAEDGHAAGFPKTKPAYRILNDLPDPLPVTAAELDMLEHQFAALIEELLKEA